MATTSIQLDRSIRAVLASLRRRIRCYVWLQGLAIVVAVLGVMFWGSLWADWFFEPPVLVRKLLLVSAVLVVAALVYRTIGRASVPLSDPSMAILLERHFPEFDDSLLTAVELTARPPDPNDCNRSLLEATCREACVPLDRVRLGGVFNVRPLTRAVVSAAILAASLIGFLSFAPVASGVWFRRTMLMSNELWPRRTVLSVEGFSDGVARVAKGADFTLIVKADMTARHVPRSIRIDYRAEGAPRLDATMIREGQAVAGRDRFQAYSYTFQGVLAPIDLNLRGGDASIRNLRIEVVDAPTLVRLDARCEYPDYMGRQPRTLAAAGVVPIPRGTRVTLHAEANKRLTRVEIFDGNDTQLVADSLTRHLEEILADCRTLPRLARGSSMTDDAKARVQTLAARLDELCEEATSRFAANMSNESVRQFVEEIGNARDVWLRIADSKAGSGAAEIGDAELRRLLERLGRLVNFSEFNYRLQPIDVTTSIQIVLHDVDGIASVQPVRLILSAVEDQPPQPIVQLRGIGSAITPQARLPLQGEIRDDHGVERVWLEYTIEGREPRQKTLRRLESVATNVALDEGFDVADLRLEPGQKILALVKARDRYDLDAGPNVGSGDRWMLDVVTPEKLRAILEAREIVLRQRFETIVEDVEAIRETLTGLSFDDESTGESEAPVAGAEPGEQSHSETVDRRRAVRLLRVQRARQNGQKDMHETAGVADAFSEIRQELVNNRIYTEELRIRIEQDIVAPLTRLVSDDFVQLDEGLARLERMHDNPAQSPGLRDGAVAQTDTILRTMREVLSRMVELEDFNEAVQLLRSIIQEQEQLREDVREQRKAKLRSLLED